MNRYQNMSGFLAAAILLAGTSAAMAHVHVTPAQAMAGATQTYDLRVPTEGKAATVKTELTVPANVTLVSVDPAGKPFEVRHAANKTSVIVWTVQVPPGETKQFQFTVRNPATGTAIVWKTDQYFADGSVRHWADGADGIRPAPTTTLTPRP